MGSHEELRSWFEASVAGSPVGLPAADRLCNACVELLGVDGASISVAYSGSDRGTFGSSSELSRRLDEFQFTFGEGPCLDSVRDAQPVLVPDFEDPGEQRWPAYAEAVLDAGVRAVYSLPVVMGDACVGALDLYRSTPGPLAENDLVGALLAAGLAARPLRSFLSAGLSLAAAEDDGSGVGLGSLQRVEVYQATGMIMGQLDIGPEEALLRLRAHAFARGLTASEAAWDVVERRLTLDDDAPHDPAGESRGVP
jgi:GAF domain-containing protein